MSNNIFDKLVDGDRLRVVQQGVLPKDNQLNNLESRETMSVGDKLRQSLDNIISNHKTKALGVLGTMILAGGALTTGIFNPSEPIKITKSDTVKSVSNVKVTNEVQSTDFLNSLKEKITTAASVDSSAPSFPLLQTSHGRYSISPELKESIESAAKFSVPEGYKENQISRYVSQVKFKSAMEKGTPQDFLSSLMSEGEGFRSNLYRDNIGLAYGIGWNVSMQNKDFNQFLMGAVNSNPEAIKQITSFSSSPIAYPSGNYGTNETKMPVQRHLQASLLIADTFKNEGVYKGLEKHVRNVPAAKQNYKEGLSYTQQTKDAFASLDPNIQAALIYHSYKVGGAGYGKYNTLNQKVAEYAFTPLEKRTIEQRREIADSISYTYKYNGETLRDTRAEIKVAAMISNPEAFGSLIKSNPAPKDMYKDVPQLQKNKVVIPKTGEEFQIPDPVGALKEESLKNGKPLDLKMQFNYADMNIGAPAPQVKPRKGLPSYW